MAEVALPSQPSAFRTAPQACRIAALTGEATEQVQALLWTFASRLQGRGLRVAGVVERDDGSGRRGVHQVRLVDLASGDTFPVFQDLGAFSTACRMDSGGILHACQAALRTIGPGVHLVVLSKFGKLEAARSGLIDAFAAAVACDLPILTTVAPAVQPDWDRFSAPLAAMLTPSLEAIEAWWDRL